MAAVITHHCRACCYNTPVVYSASVFSQNHTCNHCGIVSIGLGAQPGSAASGRAAEMQQQDELAALLQSSLSLSPRSGRGFEVDTSVSPERHEHRAPVVYASTHYTPNCNASHLLSRPVSAPTPVSVGHGVADVDVRAVLAQNSIDMAQLSPSQLGLFAAADPHQRQRLLALWRITLLHGARPDDDGMPERRTTRVDIDTLPAMTDDESGAMSCASSSSSSPPPPSHMLASTGAEPYMLSGYEMLARRDYYNNLQQQHHTQRALDGYSSTSDSIYHKASIENQYGAFQAMRGYDYGASVEAATDWCGGGDEMAM